jgi:hypothetical protein
VPWTSFDSLDAMQMTTKPESEHNINRTINADTRYIDVLKSGCAKLWQ